MSNLGDSFKLMQAQQDAQAARMSLSRVRTYLRNIITDIDEGDFDLDEFRKDLEMLVEAPDDEPTEAMLEAGRVVLQNTVTESIPIGTDYTGEDDQARQLAKDVWKAMLEAV